MCDLNERRLFADAVAVDVLRKVADQLSAAIACYEIDAGADPDSRKRLFHAGVVHGGDTAITAVRELADTIEQEAEAA